MSWRLSTKPIAGATRTVLLGLLLALRPQPLHAAPALVPADSAAEVQLAPPSRLPLLGPRYAAVTIDLFLPLGHRLTAPNLALLRPLAQAPGDVRLLFHPVLGSQPAERGAEALFAIWQQLGDGPNGQASAAPGSQGERFFTAAEALAAHPDWLADTPEAEQALRSGIAQLGIGIDAARLKRDLQQRRQRQLVASLWQRDRAFVRSPPEVWINGRRLRGQLSAVQLREELAQKRSRSYQALRNGVPLGQIYEQQLTLERSDPAPSADPPQAAGLWHRPDTAGSPSRGPQVSPVTLLLIGSLDTYGTYLLARPALEVFSRHRDTVRLVFQHAPTTESGKRVALLLTQLGLTDPAGFWRAFDAIGELMKRRFLLRYGEVFDLLLHQSVDVVELDRALRDPQRSAAARALLARDQLQAQALSQPAMSQLLLNGRPLPSLQSADQLAELVEAELHRGLLSRWLTPPH